MQELLMYVTHWWIALAAVFIAVLMALLIQMLWG
jgi:hypothetical protein